jgi:ferredoxin
MRIAIPIIEQKLCTGCGECAAVCEANAVEMVGEKAIIDYERCYSYNGCDCSTCVDVCPRNAITLMD